MAEKVQVNYKSLKEIGAKFNTQTVKTIAQIKKIDQILQNLKKGGWVSDNANDFYRYMDNILLMRMHHLARALERSSLAMEQIAYVMHQAEEFASDSIKEHMVGNQ